MNRNEALLQLLDETHRGEFHFPTSAKLAIKIRQTLEDPDCHIDAAGKLIQAEPLLAAKVIALANSVAYNPAGREITDLRNAVSRLGFSTLRTLAMAFVTRQMAGNVATPEIQVLANRLWEHTAHVAALSHLIAGKVTQCNHLTAMFAGLIHEIGGFYLLSRAEQYPALLAAPSEADCDIDLPSVENTLTLAVLRNLGIPEPVLNAVEHFVDGDLSKPPTTLGDTLMLAEYMATTPSPISPTDATEATIALDLAIEHALLHQILDESAEEVTGLVKALNG